MLIFQLWREMERYRYFTALITKINRSIKRIKSEEMNEFNLKGPHVSCLYYLYTTGGTTATEICEMSEDDKATISRSIDHLEEIGLINKRTTENKKYNVFLTLTDKGKELAQKIAVKIERILNIAGEKIKNKKRQTMYECLMTINENLESVVKSYDGETIDSGNKNGKFKLKKEEKKAKKEQKKAKKEEKRQTKKQAKTKRKTKRKTRKEIKQS